MFGDIDGDGTEEAILLIDSTGATGPAIGFGRELAAGLKFH